MSQLVILAALIEALDLKDVTLVGHSTGSYIRVQLSAINADYTARYKHQHGLNSGPKTVSNASLTAARA